MRDCYVSRRNLRWLAARRLGKFGRCVDGAVRTALLHRRGPGRAPVARSARPRARPLPRFASLAAPQGLSAPGPHLQEPDPVGLSPQASAGGDPGPVRRLAPGARCPMAPSAGSMWPCSPSARDRGGHRQDQCPHAGGGRSVLAHSGLGGRPALLPSSITAEADACEVARGRHRWLDRQDRTSGECDAGEDLR